MVCGSASKKIVGEAAFDVKTHIKCMKIKTERSIQREQRMGCAVFWPLFAVLGDHGGRVLLKGSLALWLGKSQAHPGPQFPHL